MNTRMLIRQFAAENGISIAEARRYILNIIDIIEEGLLAYGELKMPNHFSIKIVDIPEKTIWSNLFNKFMKSGGYRTAEITLGKQLNERLNDLYNRSRGVSDE